MCIAVSRIHIGSRPLLLQVEFTLAIAHGVQHLQPICQELPVQFSPSDLRFLPETDPEPKKTIR